MFTFRAHTHDENRETFEGAYYTVARLTDRQKIVIRPRWGAQDDESFVLYVGRKEPHSVVYVMNAAGKTVDTIR